MSEKMPMVVKKRKSPVDPLPISPMKIFAKDSNNEGGKHVEAARARLFHALSHGPPDSRSEPPSPKDDDVSDPDDPDSIDRLDLPTKSEPALLKRKKKGKQEEGRQAFVMKLFDRSVDLALFEESTPLYPICRAWMKNLPNQSDSLKQYNKDDTNHDMEVDEDPDDYDVDGVLNALSNGDEVNLTMLPRPLPLNDPNDRIPSPVHIERSDLDAILHADQDSIETALPTREDLLKEHHENWVAIRRNWHATERKNEDRYKDSRSILEAVYSKAQKHYQ